MSKRSWTSGGCPEIEPAFEGTKITVAFDHFGSPGADPATLDRTFAAVTRLVQTRDVYVKLSEQLSALRRQPAMLAQRWLEAVGPSRVIWGSDWPWTRHEEGRDYSRIRGDLDDWVGPRVARAALWDNAARLYAFT